MTTHTPDVILVTGATGGVGGQVVRQLLAEGGERTVRGLTRDPANAHLPEGAEVVQGDLADADSLDDALAGVTKIFLVWPTMFVEEAPSEVIDKLTGQASRIVYLSAASADDLPDPDSSSHARIERLLRDSGVEWTFVRSGGIATNDLWSSPQVPGEVVRRPFGHWARSLVHEADLAAVGVRALLTDELVRTVTPTLTGPARLTEAERLAIVAELTGRPLRFEDVPPEAARDWFLSWVPPDDVDAVMTTMQQLADEPEPVTSAVEELTGHPARTYRQWVVDHLRSFVEPTTEGVAQAYLALIRHGEFEAIFRELHAPDYVRFGQSQVGQFDGPPVELDAGQVAALVESVGEAEEIHDVRLEGPLLAGDRFAVKFTFDATDKATGTRGTYSKISLYTVHEGRITREEVFRDGAPRSR